MNVSVIISTWNNAQRLGITLDAIMRCRVPRHLAWELVIVNNHCTDDTPAVVARYRDRLPITYVEEPVQGLSMAKNKGLNQASGRLAIFTDDDVKPCADWISAYWDSYRRYPEKVFFGGPVQSEFETVPDNKLLQVAPYSVKGFNRGKRSMFLNGTYFISANWACQRDVLLELGGFDVRRGLNPASRRLVTGEEVHLMRRLKKNGWNALYVPTARVKHYVPASKCTIEHIASRVEAFSADKIISSCENKMKKKNIIVQIPMIAAVLVKSVARLGLDRLSGKKDSVGYVHWRRSVGYLRGIKECLIVKE